MAYETKQRRNVGNAFVYSGVLVDLRIHEDSLHATLALKNIGKHPIYDAEPIKSPIELSVYIRKGSENEARKKEELGGLKNFMDQCGYPLYDIKILISSAEGRKVSIARAKLLLEDPDTSCSFTRATYPKDFWSWPIAEMMLYAYKSTEPKKAFWMNIKVVPKTPASIKDEELGWNFIEQKQLARH